MVPAPGELQVLGELVEPLAGRPGPLLLILHAVQDRFGHLPSWAVPVIAERLNLSRAEVHGVIGFYHYFRTAPPPVRVLNLCRAEACLSLGARGLERHARERLQPDAAGRSADGQWLLEPVYCLGNCAAAPALMLDGRLHGRVSPSGLDGLLREPGEVP